MFIIGCEKEEENIVKDIDGNVYKTVKIGNIVWMAENLRTTRFNTGHKIQMITDSAEWMNHGGPAYCYYNNDVNNVKTYGLLYNWEFPSLYGLCPKGWSVPGEGAWDNLMEYLGGKEVAGGKLKDTTLWMNPNIGATNESGFTALPAGCRGSSFQGMGWYTVWWSDTYGYADPPFYEEGPTSYSLYNNDTFFYKSYNNPRLMGYSIRCIKNIE